MITLFSSQRGFKATAIFLTVVIVEHLTGLGKQGLDMFPYPRGPIAHHTKADVVFRNQACLFDLGEGLAQLGFILDLMPTEQMHDAPLIDEIKSKAFGITPCPLPLRALGPRAPLTRPAASSALGASGHKRPVNAQHHYRPPPFTR